MNRIKSKISICSLAYNHVNYLDDFFNGILNQQITHYKTEIIIGIDKCDDGTLDKCIAYKNKFPHLFRLIIHAERVGMMQNFVSVLSSADGEYIAFCECDDYWIDDCKLADQVKLLSSNKDAGICFTNIKMLNSRNSLFEQNWARITKEKYSLEDILKVNVITNCSVVMKNNLDINILNKVLQFRVGDWPLYILSMMKDNTIAVYMNKITAVYRQHDGGSHSTKNTLQRLDIINSVYTLLLKTGVSAAAEKLIIRALSKNYYSQGIFQSDVPQARMSYILAIKKWNLLNHKYPFLSVLRYLQTFLLLILILIRVKL